MSRFISLEPSGLSDAFDAQMHGESPVVTVDEKKDAIELSYVFPGFTMSDVEQEVDGELIPFKEVGISGAGFVSENGRPLLPSFGRFVQLPPGCDFEVEIESGAPVKFEEIIVTPAQEAATDGKEGDFEYDSKAYAEDKLYPEEVVVVGTPQNLDDYLVVPVHVRPLQHSPARKLLVGVSNVTITFKLSPKEKEDEEERDEFSLAEPESSREGFGNLLLNPRRRIAERVGIAEPSPGIIRPWPRGPQFLIIYDEALKKPAEVLGHWKNQRGLITETVSINDVGNTVSAIKKYIRGRRKAAFSRLRYVLLLGDVSAIVTEETVGNTSDHYYFTSRDASSPYECLLPWVSGGRIPVTKVSEAKAVVDQIIRYEKSPPCDREYYRKMAFAAYFQDDHAHAPGHPGYGRADRAYIKTMEGIRDHMVGLGFDVERVYVTNNPNPVQYKDGTAVPQEVKDAIVDNDLATDMLISTMSEGQLFMGHRDHGNSTGWAHPPLHKSHLEAILSQYPSIFYSINCLTGKFDADPSDSFAEAILELDGGAPSLIAATELSGTWRNDSLMKAMFDALWPGVIPTFPGTTASYVVRRNRLGDILNYGKSYLLIAHGATPGVKDHFEIYHVIGDPTLELWSEAPITVSVRARVHRNTLYIDMSSAPSGTTLTIWYRNELIKRLEPRSTKVTVPLRDLALLERPAPGLIPGRRPLMICFSAPGCRYVQLSLRV